jgi:hypothetical protein
MANAEQKTWVTRVLGYGFAGAASIAEASSAWRAAVETVDAQIAALQAALRQTDDDELHEIAEFGLNAVTGNHKVRLMAALIGAERGNEADRAKLAGIIGPFRAHLDSDDRVEACDENPFGVAMSVRATLIPALDALSRSAGG